MNTPEPAPRRPRRKGLWFFLVFLAVAIVSIVLWRRHQTTTEQASAGGGDSGATGGGRGGGRGGAGSPATMVGSETARQGDIGIYVNALGVVTPVNTVAVRSRVDGQIVKIDYQEGQEVHEGDPLIEIDSAPFQAALAQSEGQLARDTALLENAKVDSTRYQEALSKNAIAQQQLDTQVSIVHQYEGTVKLDQGQVDNAKVQLAYSHITAPISGRVGLRLVDAGNIVHSGDANPLVVITTLQPMSVIFNVAEDYLPQIQKQLRQGHSLIVDAFDRARQKKITTGTLQTLDNQIDTSTGTLKLKALFTNDDEALFPNQFVNARLLVETHQNVTLLPNPVIQRNSQGAFVYLLQPDQTVKIQTITVGPTDGDVSEIQGLEAGATVAADNFNRLTEGAKITLRQSSAGAAGRGEQGAPDASKRGSRGPRRGGSTNAPGEGKRRGAP